MLDRILHIVNRSLFGKKEPNVSIKSIHFDISDFRSIYMRDTSYEVAISYEIEHMK